MLYEKKIKYLDYCENGERIKSGGVLKLEQRENDVGIELMIRGVPGVGSLDTDVILLAASQIFPLGEINLRGGNGEFKSRFHIPIEEWEEIHIRLSDNEEIVGRWSNKKKKVDSSELFEDLQWEEPETVRAEVPKTEPEKTELSEQKKLDEKMRIADEKWQQLWRVYPHIRPYGDDREYLSIRPADFVIFSEESYKKLNNSFLLHGYYNYGHLILARVRRQSGYVYYVGTPGSYFEREKQVAIMFGFESFECEKEPAQAGDFGYYMMRGAL